MQVEIELSKEEIDNLKKYLEEQSNLVDMGWESFNFADRILYKLLSALDPNRA